MAKLPSGNDLGGLPDIHITGGVPRIDMSMVGRGYQHFGTGLEKLATGVEAGLKIQDNVAEKDADAKYGISQDKAYFAALQNPDFKNAPDQYRDAATGALTDAASGLTGKTRANFISRHSQQLEHRYNELGYKGRDQYIRETQVDNNGKIQDLLAGAIADPTMAKQRMDEAMGMVDNEATKFKYTAPQLRARQREVITPFKKAWATDQINNNSSGVAADMDKIFPTVPNPNDTGVQPVGPQSNLSGGAAYLAQRRAPFREELQDPQTRKLVGAVISSENPRAGTSVVESLFNRTELVNQDRQAHGLPPVTVKDMILGAPGIAGGKSFYGPVRDGRILGHLRRMDNPNVAAAMNDHIDTALDGSNTIEGHTDQGGRGDPNYYTGGTGVNINGERFNHWQYPGAVAFQQKLQHEYASAEMGQPVQVASRDTGTASDASPEKPDQTTRVAMNKTGTPWDLYTPTELLAVKKQNEVALRARERDARQAERDNYWHQEHDSQEKLGDILTNKENYTSEQVRKMEGLLPNHKLTAMKFLEKPENKDEASYGPGFKRVIGLLSAEDSDPNKITTQAQLMDYYNTHEDLLYPGLKEANAALKNIKDPKDAAGAKLQDQFFKGMHDIISRENEFTHTKDPEGELRYSHYFDLAYPMYRKFKEDGVSVPEIHKQLEEMGKLPEYKREDSQDLSDRFKDTPPQRAAGFGNAIVEALSGPSSGNDLVNVPGVGMVATTKDKPVEPEAEHAVDDTMPEFGKVPAFKSTLDTVWDTSTKEGLQAAAASGQIPMNDAKKLARERGYTRPNDPSVPRSE